MPNYKEFLSETISELYTKAKDTVEQSGVKDTVKDFYEQGANKAKSYGQIAKLTVESGSEGSELKRVYAEIGKLFFEENMIAPSDAYAPLFEKAAALRESIAAKEDRLTELKAVRTESSACEENADSADIDVEISEFENVVDATEEDGITVEITGDKE